LELVDSTNMTPSSQGRQYKDSHGTECRLRGLREIVDLPNGLFRIAEEPELPPEGPFRKREFNHELIERIGDWCLVKRYKDEAPAHFESHYWDS
jgi:hypothetical protein